jgi:DNA helicase MCM8
MAGVQFKHLAHALSPAIYGNELLKAGLLLALLGGVRKVSDQWVTLRPQNSASMSACCDSLLIRRLLVSAWSGSPDR